MFAQRPRLVAQAARSGADRPHRRSRRRARAVGHPRAHDAPDRSRILRDRLHDLDDLGQPPDAAARRQGSRADARATARERHPGCARDGPGGAARLRPQAAARPRAGGRRRRPRTSRSWRARSASRRSATDRRTPPASPIRAMPSSSTAPSGLDATCAPRRTSRRPMPERVRFRARRQAQYAALRDKPCVTKDGQPVDTAAQRRACWSTCRTSPKPAATGIGLFRTELQFMVAPSPAAHRRPAVALSSRCSTPRASGLSRSARSTSAATRCCPTCDTEDRGKSRAWLAGDPARARPARPAAQPDPRPAATRRPGANCASCSRWSRRSPSSIRPRRLSSASSRICASTVTRLPERVHVGTMVEVPALLYQLDELLEARRLSSRSARTISLQFMFAVDRGNVHLVSEAVRLAVAAVPARAQDHRATRRSVAKKPVTLCGELASQPIGALALIAIGFRSMSVSASSRRPRKGDDPRPRRQEGRPR